MQQVIVKDNSKEDMFFYDATCWEDYYEEYGYSFGRFKVIGVGIPGIITHQCAKSALYEDLTDYKDVIQEETIAKLADDVLYTVCYFKYDYKTDDGCTLYQCVDHEISRQDIIDNILSNRYVEGAEIYETKKLITSQSYNKKFKSMEYREMVFYPYRDLGAEEKISFMKSVSNKKMCSFNPADWNQKEFLETAKENCSRVDLYTVKDTIVMPTVKGLYLYRESFV